MLLCLTVDTFPDHIQKCHTDIVQMRHASCPANRFHWLTRYCSLILDAALAMIDEGELDWKVVAISTADPRYKLVNDVADLEVHFPGTLSAVRYTSPPGGG